MPAFELEDLRYQQDAVRAVVDVFKGSERRATHELAGNRCTLAWAQLSSNLQAVAQRHRISDQRLNLTSPQQGQALDVCVLYLARAGLLDAPVLYLSRYINQHKLTYYRLLQAVRDDANPASWTEWVVFMLKAVAQTAQSTVELVDGMRELMANTKQRLRTELPKLYSQDLLNNLFRHPYTRIEFVQRDLDVTRQTASKYLKQLADKGFVQEHSRGKHSYFINLPLVRLIKAGDR